MTIETKDIVNYLLDKENTDNILSNYNQYDTSDLTNLMRSYLPQISNLPNKPTGTSTTSWYMVLIYVMLVSAYADIPLVNMLDYYGIDIQGIFNKRSVGEYSIDLCELAHKLHIASDFTTKGIGKNKELIAYIGEDVDVVIPKDIKILGNNAFCDYVKSITISSNVECTSATFYSCPNIKTINIVKGKNDILTQSFKLSMTSLRAMYHVTFTLNGEPYIF